ncbi:MAG: KxYKxGKxW signal peptide domain-containing protein [Prevotella sp.]|nr:KxYKxGKxW signal peptide domain-containing protein [Prevotella sp.]
MSRVFLRKSGKKWL